MYASYSASSRSSRLIAAPFSVLRFPSPSLHITARSFRNGRGIACTVFHAISMVLSTYSICLRCRQNTNFILYSHQGDFSLLMSVPARAGKQVRILVHLFAVTVQQEIMYTSV